MTLLFVLGAVLLFDLYLDFSRRQSDEKIEEFFSEEEARQRIYCRRDAQIKYFKDPMLAYCYKEGFPDCKGVPFLPRELHDQWQAEAEAAEKRCIEGIGEFQLEIPIK